MSYNRTRTVLDPCFNFMESLMDPNFYNTMDRLQRHAHSLRAQLTSLKRKMDVQLRSRPENLDMIQSLEGELNHVLAAYETTLREMQAKLGIAEESTNEFPVESEVFFDADSCDEPIACDEDMTEVSKLQNYQGENKNEMEEELKDEEKNKYKEDIEDQDNKHEKLAKEYKDKYEEKNAEEDSNESKDKNENVVKDKYNDKYKERDEVKEEVKNKWIDNEEEDDVDEIFDVEEEEEEEDDELNTQKYESIVSCSIRLGETDIVQQIVDDIANILNLKDDDPLREQLYELLNHWMKTLDITEHENQESDDAILHSESCEEMFNADECGDTSVDGAEASDLLGDDEKEMELIRKVQEKTDRLTQILMKEKETNENLRQQIDEIKNEASNRKLVSESIDPSRLIDYEKWLRSEIGWMKDTLNIEQLDEEESKVLSGSDINASERYFECRLFNEFPQLIENKDHLLETIRQVDRETLNLNIYEDWDEADEQINSLKRKYDKFVKENEELVAKFAEERNDFESLGRAMAETILNKLSWKLDQVCDMNEPWSSVESKPTE